MTFLQGFFLPLAFIVFAIFFISVLLFPLIIGLFRNDEEDISIWYVVVNILWVMFLSGVILSIK